MVAMKENSGQANVTPSVEHEVEPYSQNEAQSLLDRARALLKKRLSFFVWQGFFEPIEAISLEKGCLKLEAPTSFHRNWVYDHYMPELQAAVAEACGQEIRVELASCPEQKRLLEKEKQNKIKRAARPAAEQKDQGAPIEGFTQTTGPGSVLPLPPSEKTTIRPSVSLDGAAELNPKYSFDSFVQGPSNQMGFAASHAVADHPGTQYSPLFLFGGVGLGKTHLLHSIGLRAKQNNPNLRVIYMSAEQWVNAYIQAIRERQFDAFRRRFRQACDILLVDDIQFLAGKDASQDEFFHTFNALHEGHKQIVVSSDMYPHEIQGLEERLQTRLSWGLVADIRPPEMETRIAILHQKAANCRMKLPDDVAFYLASQVTSSVRELEGALVRLSAFSSISGHEISLAQAQEQLAPVIKRKKVTSISPEKICDVVAKYYDLRPAELTGTCRQRQVTLARQVAMSFCRSLLSMSLPEIGRAFGGRDHTTVLSSLRKIDQMRQYDIGLQTVLARLEEQFMQH